MEDTMSSKAAYKVHKVFTLQAFVATFKSLVVFVSKEHLCFFVSLCLKKHIRLTVTKLFIGTSHYEINEEMNFFTPNH